MTAQYPVSHVDADRSNPSFAPSMETKQRIPGLDMLRALAILLVLAAHVLFFIQYFASEHPIDPPVIHAAQSLSSVMGILGVELFFVLSGFLIGEIIIRQILQKPSLSALKTFYLRRWLRTLPAYYVVLIGLVAVDNLVLHHPNGHWSHFVFLQNFFPSDVLYFGVSWSLAVEEWFYLLTPLLLLTLTKKGDGRSFLQAVAILLLLIVGIRIAYVLLANPTYDVGVRKLIPLRFDSLLCGVLLAGIKVYFGTFYRCLAKPMIVYAALLTLFALCAWGFLHTAAFDHSFFARTLSFTLMSFALGLLIPYFEMQDGINRHFQKQSILTTLFTRVSLWSYSIYLLHFEVMRLVMHRTPSWEAFWPRMSGAVVSVIFAAFLLYTFVEYPLIQFRDRHIRQN